MKDLYRAIKNFILRGKNGWCPEDTWNLDIYLSKVISETTVYLAKHTINYPPEMSFKQWKEILHQISKDIRIKKLCENEKEQLRAYVNQKEALKLFVTYFNYLWD